MKGPSRVVVENEREVEEEEEDDLVTGDAQRRVPRGRAKSIEPVEKPPCSANAFGRLGLSVARGTEAM